jgi:hypothetical protein
MNNIGVFLQNLAAALNGTVSDNDVVEGNFQGRDFTIEYFGPLASVAYVLSEAGSPPPELEVGISCENYTSLVSDEYFSVRREILFDKIEEPLFLEKKIKTGDAEFDKKYYILTKNEQASGSFFSSPIHRTEVSRIFEIFEKYSINRMNFQPDFISVILQFLREKPLDEITPEVVKSVLSELLKLSWVSDKKDSSVN